MKTAASEILTWPDPPALRRGAVLRYLGYRPGRTRLTPDVTGLVDQVLAEATACIHCRAIVTEREVLYVGEGKVLLEGMPHPWISRSLARLLAQAPIVTLYFLTIGKELEEAVDRYFAAGEYARATILEAVASHAVHAGVLRLRGELAQEKALTGFGPTLPFGPGYGDWDLGALTGLACLLGDLPRGVRITGSGYLEPRKSMAGLLGWIPAEVPGGGEDGYGGGIAGGGGPDGNAEPGRHGGASGPAGAADSYGSRGPHRRASEYGCPACLLADCRYRIGLPAPERTGQIVVNRGGHL